jgi:hypothetical protein
MILLCLTWFAVGCVCGAGVTLVTVLYAVAALQGPKPPRPGTPRQP